MGSSEEHAFMVRCAGKYSRAHVEALIGMATAEVLKDSTFKDAFHEALEFYKRILDYQKEHGLGESTTSRSRRRQQTK